MKCFECFVFVLKEHVPMAFSSECFNPETNKCTENKRLQKENNDCNPPAILKTSTDREFFSESVQP